MQSYRLTPDGPAYRLQLTDGSSAEPTGTQVKIRVRATALNYRDLINLKNTAGRKVDGIVPLSDGAGEVLAIGPGVTRWQAGDRVAACFFQTWLDGRFEMAHHRADLGGTINGMLAEEVLLDEQGLVRVPEHLTFVEAACLSCAGLTAWNALVTRGELQAGATVLALGTGGVSIFALQFAKALGATVIITSSSDEKLQRALELGATHGINYRTTPDWAQQVQQLTAKRGADHVVEVGGPGTLEQSLKSVAAGGHIALVGVLTGFGPASISLFPAVSRNARLDGIYVGSRANFETMNQFISSRQLRPVIDREFEFADAPAAYEYLEAARHFGKIVIRH